MKAEIIDVGIRCIGIEDFDWVNIKLIPETEEEIFVARIAENHRRVTEEKLSKEVANLDCVSCCPEEIDMHIVFPKNSVSEAT